MAADYQTELEALNALCDKIDSLNTKIDSVDSHVDGLEGQVQAIQGYTDGIEGKIDATNLKLDSANDILSGLRGAVIDVKNQPEDACIIRVYVGDQTHKREAAATEIERLLGLGYRPYQTFGISEDLARVLFVKYPEPNDANVTP